MFFDIQALIDHDRTLKPGGAAYEQQAIKLAQVYDDRAAQLTRDHIRELGLKYDPKLPVSVNMLRRVIDDLAVAYRLPPKRTMMDDGTALKPDDPITLQAEATLERAEWDLAWPEIDRGRGLFGLLAVTYSESSPHRSTQMRIFEPFNLFRRPDPRALDVIDSDYAVALQIAAGDTGSTVQVDENDLFEVWQRDDQVWRLHVVNGAGELAGEQPYGEDGLSPFGDVLPVQLVYDRPPMGRAYPVLSESRLAFALNINAAVNDLLHLIRHEAHTTPAITTEDPRGVPKQAGPGVAWVLPDGTEVKTLNNNPKVRELGEVIDQVLRLFATTEFLPPDTFKVDRQILTGVALKVSERPQERRAQRLSKMALREQREGYRKLRAVHNVYAPSWGQKKLDPGVSLRAVVTVPPAATDPKEQQAVLFNDLSIGAISFVDYLQQAFHLSRDQAVHMYERVQEDRKKYKPDDGQNPAATLKGAALAGVDATPTAGALNPDRSRATEGASLADSVRHSGIERRQTDGSVSVLQTG